MRLEQRLLLSVCVVCARAPSWTVKAICAVCQPAWHQPPGLLLLLLCRLCVCETL